MKKAIPVLINFMRIFLILSLFISCIGKNPDKAKDSLIPETEIIYSEKPVSVVTFESPASKNSQNKQPSEINDNTDLFVSLDYIKTGRKVTAVQFELNVNRLNYSPST